MTNDHFPDGGRLSLGVALDAGSRVRSLRAQLDRHRSVIAAAERAGYESVWVGETYSMGMPAPFQWLAALSTMTDLRLGTGVLLLPTWNPLRLACEAAVIDRLTDGRFDLGIGVARAPVQRRFGVEPSTVGTWVDEVLQALRVLWAGQGDYHGSIVHVEGPIDPLPTRPSGPPIWVGGAIRRSVERAAAYGDAWYASTTYTFEKVREQIERYRAELASRGMPAAPVAANRFVLVADTDQAAEAAAERFLGPSLVRYARHGSLGAEWRQFDGSAAEAFRRFGDQLVIVGSVATVRTKLDAYRSIGVDDIHARLLPDEAPAEVAIRSVELLAEANGIGR